MRISRKVRPTVVQFAIALLFAAHALLPTRQLSAEMVDRVVAVVNNDVITLSDLEREGEATFRKIAATAPADKRAAYLAAARAEILDTMIDKHLITQKAAAKKITVSDGEVEEALANVLQRTGMTKEQLLARLDASGIDEDIYRTTLKTQILQNKLVGSDISAKIIITEEMILDHYDNNYVSRSSAPAKSGNGSGYYLLQIGCSWQNADKAAARKQAEKAHSLAKAGEDFGELARKFSDLPSSAEGGDIGTFELDDMAADMRKVIAGLKPGEISEIIETSSGYQFFKVLSGSGEETLVAKAPYEQVKETIKQELYEQEMKKAYAQWVKELKEQAYIQKL